MDNQQKIDAKSLEWLAGVFDSEGFCSVSLNGKNKSKLFCRIGISNTDKKILYRTKAIVSNLGVAIKKYKSGGTKLKWKQSYDLSVSGYTNCKLFLESILPFLVGKKEICNLGLKIMNSRIKNYYKKTTNAEFEMVDRLSRMNKRGKSISQRLRAEQSNSLLKIKSDLDRDIKSIAEMSIPSPYWIGGLIDGDGCITVVRQKNGRKPVLSVTNTNAKIIKAVTLFLDKNNVSFYMNKRYFVARHKDAMQIEVHGIKQCSKIFPVLLPYVYAKKNRLILALRYVKSRLSGKRTGKITEKELKICKKITALNKRGK